MFKAFLFLAFGIVYISTGLKFFQILNFSLMGFFTSIVFSLSPFFTMFTICIFGTLSFIYPISFKIHSSFLGMSQLLCVISVTTPLIYYVEWLLYLEACIFIILIGVIYYHWNYKKLLLFQIVLLGFTLIFSGFIFLTFYSFSGTLMSILYMFAFASIVVFLTH